MPDMPSNAKIGKLKWVEPAALVLDVEQTFNLPNRGRDGNRHADCTRS